MASRKRIRFDANTHQMSGSVNVVDDLNVTDFTVWPLS